MRYYFEDEGNKYEFYQFCYEFEGTRIAIIKNGYYWSYEMIGRDIIWDDDSDFAESCRIPSSVKNYAESCRIPSSVKNYIKKIIKNLAFT
jgi:hypothetical protein